MVAFAVVFHSKFPVGVDAELEGAVRAAVIHRLIHDGPARDEIFVKILERVCLAVDVDKHGVKPDVAADFVQAEGGFVDGRVGVVARTAHMGGGDKRAFGRIAPGMIGAANGPFDFARGIHEDHAAMAADVFKHPHLTVAVADQQKRDTKEGDGFCVTRFWNF